MCNWIGDLEGRTMIDMFITLYPYFLDELVEHICLVNHKIQGRTEGLLISSSCCSQSVLMNFSLTGWSLYLSLRKTPDLPPALYTTRVPEMYMALSTALHMS